MGLSCPLHFGCDLQEHLSFSLQGMDSSYKQGKQWGFLEAISLDQGALRQMGQMKGIISIPTTHAGAASVAQLGEG